MILKKVAVIGYPVKHSLSPKLHGFWIDKYKQELKNKSIEAEYGMLEIQPSNLENTLLSLKDNGYVGCNLTVPHKETAFEIIKKYGTLSESAKAIKAVNTITLQNDGKLFGTNTDSYGFIENIKSIYPEFSREKVVVIGAGGAARAVVFGLLENNVKSIVITNRTKDKAEKIKADFNKNIAIENWEDREEILQNASMLINTTVLGMSGQEQLQISLDKLPKEALVTDIVYKPLETSLLKNARNRGNKVVDGLGMLLYQAQGGFELWYGIKPQVTEDLKKHIL